MATRSWPAAVEGGPDGRHLAVHHPARRHDVGARRRPGRARSAVQLERRVVADLAVGTEHAAVPVVGVLVEAEVRHQDELVAHRVAHGAQRDLHDAVGVPGAASLGVLDARGRRRGSAPGSRARRAAWPRPRASRRVCWTSPGIDGIGTGASIPSRTKSGATRSSTPRRASATSRRSAGVRRSRRSRRAGKPPQRVGVASGTIGVASAMPPAYEAAARVRAEVADQLVDDRLRPRNPMPRGRRRSRRRAPPPAVVGPMHTTWAGAATAAPSGVRSAMKACDRGGRGEGRARRPAATRASSSGSGAAAATVRYASTRRTAQPFSRQPLVDRVRRDVGAGEEARRGRARPVGAGNVVDQSARAVLGRHQVRLDARAAQRVGGGRPDRGDAAPGPSARASRSSAMKRSTALTEVNDQPG